MDYDEIKDRVRHIITKEDLTSRKLNSLSIFANKDFSRSRVTSDKTIIKGSISTHNAKVFRKITFDFKPDREFNEIMTGDPNSDRYQSVIETTDFDKKLTKFNALEKLDLKLRKKR